MIKGQLLAFADALDKRAQLLDEAIEAGEAEAEDMQAAAAGIVTAVLIAEAIRDVWGRQN